MISTGKSDVQGSTNVGAPLVTATRELVARGLVVSTLMALALIVLTVTAGCGGSRSGRPSGEALLAIENVAKWYQLCESANNGNPPANEEDFLAFVNSKLAERGQEPIDRDKLLTSPRDGEPYVILYGEAASKKQGVRLVAYEKSGVAGMKLAVSDLARSRLVEESELQSLLSGK